MRSAILFDYKEDEGVETYLLNTAPRIARLGVRWPGLFAGRRLGDAPKQRYCEIAARPETENYLSPFFGGDSQPPSGNEDATDPTAYADRPNQHTGGERRGLGQPRTQPMSGG